jgi:hypothetical protein
MGTFERTLEEIVRLNRQAVEVDDDMGCVFWALTRRSIRNMLRALSPRINADVLGADSRNWCRGVRI